MELRMIDAQPGDGWIVPAAVVTALADDDRAADAALAAAEPVWDRPAAEDPWLRAARYGPADPVIARASEQCFETAEAALMRSGAPAEIRQAVTGFIEQYVQKDRCPADDQLDGVR
jgi:glutamate--cysteine ligase